MADFLAFMLVPIMVDLDVDNPTPKQRKRLEARLVNDLKKNGYGNAQLQELLVAPKEIAVNAQ